MTGSVRHDELGWARDGTFHGVQTILVVLPSATLGLARHSMWPSTPLAILTPVPFIPDTLPVIPSAARDLSSCQ
jgi:hypothetical protein